MNYEFVYVLIVWHDVAICLTGDIYLSISKFIQKTLGEHCPP